LSPILWAPLQLNFLAAFSASALVSKRAGVASWLELVEHPINNTEKVIKKDEANNLTANIFPRYPIFAIKYNNNN